MKISYNWLKELLPSLALDPAQVAQKLTFHSLETVVAYTIAIDPAITVVKVVATEPHPNADRLQLVTIETSNGLQKVVCGAKNFKVGDLVPYSPPGAKVVDEEGNRFEVKTAKIRGVESPGMLNSLRELGLGASHAGLFILPPDVPVGSKLQDHIPNDTVFEVDVTPNRAHDAVSHIGIARELAALEKITIQEPDYVDLNEAAALPKWEIKVDGTHTSHYLGAVLHSVKIAPSPLWLQARLLTLGARPINNVVDITNYVMWEVGNPTHAFDSNKLDSTTMTVRFAQVGEQLLTLDGKTHTLSPNVLVITNGDTPVAAAGVIGGQATEVDDTTTSVFLEAATFDPTVIRHASDALQTKTDSSIRFSKGLSPVLAQAAAARVITLLQNIVGAEVVGKIEHYPIPQQVSTIAFDPTGVSKLAGITISEEQSYEALAQLRCQVEKTDSTWQVQVPLDRLDLEGPHDLVEEVVRLIGLDHIPAHIPASVDPLPLPPAVRLREFVRDELCAAGLTEVYSYSFEDEPFAKQFNLLDDQALVLSNPIAPEQAKLRTSLVSGLLRALKNNRSELQKPFKKVEKAFFEVGHAYRQGDGGKVPGVIEEEHVAAVMLSGFEGEVIIHTLLQKLGAQDIANDKGTLKCDGFIVGWIATYTSNEISFLRSLKSEAQAIELNMEALLKLNLVPAQSWVPAATPETNIQYKAVGAYPPAYRDLSIIVASTTKIEDVENIIERVGGKLLVESELFDEYDMSSDSQNSDMDPKKSLAFHLAYQSPERTLGNDEVNELHNNIVATLHQEIGAQLRE